MSYGTVTIVMPAYNEEDGIVGFLQEIADHVVPLVKRLEFVIIDDVSRDETASRVEAMAPTQFGVTLVRSSINRGHGPTAIEAYTRGLALDPEVVVHVDGDGQFLGTDFPAVLAALEGFDGVHGVRSGRTDPWFRKVLSSLVRVMVLLVARHRVTDVNTPLRAYRPEALRRLLGLVPRNATVPHVHFSILEHRLGIRIHEVEVQSIPRRGATQLGTMWGPTKREPKLPPRRLIAFAMKALREVLTVDVARVR